MGKPPNFRLKLHGTWGEHDQELLEACYRILMRYVRIQKECCVCGDSRAMKRAKSLIRIYRMKRLWDDWDLKNMEKVRISKQDKCIRTAQVVWLRLVSRVAHSLWC